MSRVMRKPAFCIREKQSGADLRVRMSDLVRNPENRFSLNEILSKGICLSNDSSGDSNEPP